MSRTRSWLLGAGSVLLLVLAVLWWRSEFEWVREEVEQPARGEARYNPMYALQQSLRTMGYEVRARSSLKLEHMGLQPGDLLILGTDVRTLSEDEAHELRHWIGAGGHLLFGLPTSKGERRGALLSALELTLSTSKECMHWRGPDGSTEGRICSRYRVRLDPDADSDVLWFYGKSKQGVMAVRAAYGEGSWMLMPGLGFLGRKQLQNEANAELAWQLIGPVLSQEQGQGRVHLVYAAQRVPAYVWLVKNAWPVLLSLLLALLLWLWSRSQALGPRLILPPAHRRGLLEHLQAAAELAFRRGRGEVLHAALRQRRLRHLQRQHPQLIGLQDEALVQALASVCQKSPASVRAALFPDQLKRPDRFQSAMSLLNRLRERP